MSKSLEFANNFCKWIDASPTPFHSVRTASSRLVRAGFNKISEASPFEGQISPGGKYFYTRNGGTLVAFVVGKKFEPKSGFKIIGAHTDSPVLKVKPRSDRTSHGFVQVGSECYGGGLWHTWLDRDLGVAGRVAVRDAESNAFVQRLVHISEPLMRVSSLCIHLQSGKERSALEVNKENHLIPVISQEIEETLNASSTPSESTSEGAKRQKTASPLVAPPVLLARLAQELEVDVSDIVDFELTLCDTQKAALGGVNKEFVYGPRLDNQIHCYLGVEALCAASEAVVEDDHVNMLVLFDHEEVGSQSATGAGSPIVRDAVERISLAFQVSKNTEDYKIGLTKSFLVSADGAHSVLPTHASKHEAKHTPTLNHGLVIKTNSNQRYATNMVTGFVRPLHSTSLSLAHSLGAQTDDSSTVCPNRNADPRIRRSQRLSMRLYHRTHRRRKHGNSNRRRRRVSVEVSARVAAARANRSAPLWLKLQLTRLFVTACTASVSAVGLGICCRPRNSFAPFTNAEERFWLRSNRRIELAVERRLSFKIVNKTRFNRVFN